MPERLEAKWDAMNIKRLMNILLTMKRFDPQMLAIRIKPEKDRMIYKEEKRKAIAESFRKVNDEMCSLRARLLPARDDNEESGIEQLDFVKKNVESMAIDCRADFDFGHLEQENTENVDDLGVVFRLHMNNCLSFQVNKFKQERSVNLNYNEIMKRSRQRRATLNRSLVDQANHRPSIVKHQGAPSPAEIINEIKTL